MSLGEGHRRVTELAPNSQYNFLIDKWIESHELSFYHRVSILTESVNFFGQVVIL